MSWNDWYDTDNFYWAKGVIDANKVVDRPLPSHRQIGNIGNNNHDISYHGSKHTIRHVRGIFSVVGLHSMRLPHSQMPILCAHHNISS
jgi:hypothetical protein